ncbi:fpd1 benzoylformate decarboxylase [Colletotrichum karsti]|uniref:Fpd1 benzoylformate decarboxylase n=1 Tax=Colletotrichum karsti TaxID=1095194 RepID=A0A9P6I438_9PEZI|nr:fpd1 benzoylformate decarboxylase [Colletotrichum karsti]KAF9876983.1 fpd1 benzoylformate decarboxylase [Colletotrichum karsti]
MLPTTIRSPPAVADYTPIEEHQAQTPETFFGGKPVLHYQLDGAKAWIPASQKGSLAVFPADISTTATAPEGATLRDSNEELAEQQVSVFVNSENFTIFSAAAVAGVAIPYPSISIHAVKQVGSISETTPLQAIWMQLQLADGGDGDDDYNTIDLTIVPAVTDGAQADVQKFYDAISACSDLHPDPVDEDEEDDDCGRIIFENDHEPVEGYSGVLHGAADGGLPPAFPGSGGWITAENVHLHFDADGNWIGGQDGEEGGELGEGAGRVRGHEEVNGAEVNGHDDPENKRPRVDEQ